MYSLYFCPKFYLLTDLISLVFSVYVNILVCFYTRSECTERETTHIFVLLF